MKPFLLLFAAIMMACVSSCVNKEKEYKDITNEMNLNVNSLGFTTATVMTVLIRVC